MRSSTFLILLFFFLGTILNAQTVAEAPDGDGTELTPYEIGTLANLLWISENDSEWDKHYIQTANIDAAETATWNSGEGWLPIGSYGTKFTGSYNGGYHEISNLFIDRESTNYQGLFAHTYGATIEKLVLKEVDFTGQTYVGGVVANLDNSKLFQVAVLGGEIVSNGDYGGVIAGYSVNSEMEQVFANAKITGNDDYIGGLSGHTHSVIIKDSYSTSIVKINNAYTGAGGFTGGNIGSSEIYNSYFAGTFEGSSGYIGSIVAYNQAPTSESGVFWDKELSGVTENIGIAQGLNTDEMTDVATYIIAGWDLKGAGEKGIWNIGNTKNDGYPYLNWLHPTDDGPELPSEPILFITSIDKEGENIKVEIQFTYLGDPEVEEAGVVWGTPSKPTVEDNYLTYNGAITAYQLLEIEIDIEEIEIGVELYYRGYTVEDENTYYSINEKRFFLAMEFDGEGTPENPYQISNFKELTYLSLDNSLWDKHFIQTANIDASDSEELNGGEGWSPIGNSSNNFTGSYNGAYYEISNLFIDRNENYQGLFGNTQDAIIQKLILRNVNIIGKFYVGGIVGRIDGGGLKQVAVIDGEVYASDNYVGSVIGEAFHTQITETYGSAKVGANNNFGGIAGYVVNSIIENSYSTSHLDSKSGWNIGAGIIGNLSSGELYNSYFAGTFEVHNQYLNGITNYTPSIEESVFWDKELSGVTSNEGTAQGLNTDEMTSFLTYFLAGWDFKDIGDDDIWNIGNGKNNGYPYLNWLHSDDDGPELPNEPLFLIKSISEEDENVKVEVQLAYLGDPNIDEIGLVWNTSENPTVGGQGVTQIVSQEPISIGDINMVAIDVPIGEPVYYRVYAIQDSEIIYSGEKIYLLSVEGLTGEGTEEAPYQISNLGELIYLSENNTIWDKYFIQTADIDASYTKQLNEGEGWKPIGNDWGNEFTGSYNGDNHEISNLFIDRDQYYQGLFGYTDGATIGSLVLRDIDITGQYYVGGAVGYLEESEITKVAVISGKISSSYDYTGSVVGYSSSSVLNEVYGSTKISGKNYFGGVVGYTESNSIIKNSYSTSEITTSDSKYSGGIVGYNLSSGLAELSNSYFAGTFNGASSRIGGVVGDWYAASQELGTFWDKEFSGVTVNRGTAQGLETEEMTDIKTFIFAGWDFKGMDEDDIWNIGNGRNNGYPYLNWLFPDDNKPKEPVFALNSISEEDRDVKVEVSLVYLGNPAIEEVGVVWSESVNPTIGGEGVTKVVSEDVIALGDVYAIAHGVAQGKTVYYRAYVIQDSETIYSNQESFELSYLLTGEGTEANPYLIGSFEDLKFLSENDPYWGSYFKQTADIDASDSEELNSGDGWSPIGNSSTKFTGTYDGGNHEISNLFINSGLNYQGLFGYTNGATIQKLILKEIDITGYSYVGSLVGYSIDSELTQVAVIGGEIKGVDYYFGSVVGYSSNSELDEVYGSTKVSGYNYLGGIVGYTVSSSVIKNSYSTSEITTSGSQYSGGIVGYIGSNGLAELSNSYFAGTFNGTSSRMGGVVGDWYSATQEFGTFWDKEFSEVTANLGTAQGLDTEEMTDIKTFTLAGWDFKGIGEDDIWNIGNSRNGGYPYLNWLYPDDDAPKEPLFYLNSISEEDGDVKVEVSLIYLGNPAIEEVGVVWSESQNPAIGGEGVTKVVSLDDVELGDIRILVNDVTQTKIIFYRAYVKQESDIIYSNEESFVLPYQFTGEGTEGNPYEISTFEDLLSLSGDEAYWDKHFIQTADIDASDSEEINGGEGWLPIGNSSIRFTGSYNGNYHEISNLSIDREANYQGFFGYTDGATIEKLIIKEVDFTGGYYVGGVVGYLRDSKLYQVAVMGGQVIATSEYSGSAVGYSNNSQIIEVQADTEVLASNYLGGIVGGTQSNTIIRNSFSTSQFNLEAGGVIRTGGIVGYNSYEAYIAELSNSYFAGTSIGSSNYQQAVVGYWYAPVIESGTFWDKQLYSVPNGYSSATGLQTAEMKQLEVFLLAGWDFKGAGGDDIWNIGNDRNDGYPYLNWLYPDDDAPEFPAEPVFSIISIDEEDEKVKIEVQFTYLGTPVMEEAGIVWGTSPNPTVEDNLLASDDAIVVNEPLEIEIEGLEKGIILYYRGYAIEGADTYYSTNEVNFILSMDLVGDGSPETPYEISNFKELIYLSLDNSLWDKHFIQTADIDASYSEELNDGEGWLPIGISSANAFTGSYNGDYHEISNLFINSAENNQGLFGYVNDAIIQKLVLKNVDLNVGGRNVGGVVGSLYDSELYQVAVIDGKINSLSGLSYNYGGVVGFTRNSQIDEIFGSVYVSGNQLGGLIGLTYSGTIVKNSYSISNITTNGNNVSAGIIGGNNSGGVELYNSYFAGTFDGVSSNMGGVLSGSNLFAAEANNFWDSELTGVENNLGSAEGLTTAEMQDINTFLSAGWDFVGLGDDEIWEINPSLNNGYPYLVWVEDYMEESISVDIESVVGSNLNAITIYPNPFNDFITISVTDGNIKSVQIISSTGLRTVLTTVENENSITINTADILAGVYILIVENDDGVVSTQKLIKN